ncbi:MAG TPA: hypothetical protein VFS34_17745 [Thermoanaerobaculia bacterium]|nr:hypothetical protein [Thermoanaerobaculia bacterium]
MKTTAIPMAKSPRRRPAREDRDEFTGFFEYTCPNAGCVLSRFDRFSMAAAADARCPVCGERAEPAREENPGSAN